MGKFDLIAVDGVPKGELMTPEKLGAQMAQMLGMQQQIMSALLAQQQEITQPDGGSTAGQIALTDQIRPDPGQISLRLIGVQRIEKISRHKPQHAVAQKLQPFITGAAIPFFIGIGAVGQGIFQQAFIPEGIAQPFFQFRIHS